MIFIHFIYIFFIYQLCLFVSIFNFNSFYFCSCLHNAAGTRPALFIAEAAFELLARRQIEMLREPALQAVDLVHEELR